MPISLVSGLQYAAMMSVHAKLYDFARVARRNEPGNVNILDSYNVLPINERRLPQVR